MPFRQTLSACLILLVSLLAMQATSAFYANNLQIAPAAKPVEPPKKAKQDVKATTIKKGDATPANEQPPKQASTKLPEKSVALNKQKTVYLNAKKKSVWLKTEVVMNNGLLEMLCCLKQTKEHESIFALDAKAATVHAALLAVGAKVGKPVQFDPEFQPPTGQKISIFVHWVDKDGKQHRTDARSWIQTATRRYFAVKMTALPEGLKLPDDSELKFDSKFEELIWFGTMTKDEKASLTKLSQDKGFQKAIGDLFSKSQPKPMKEDWVFAGSYFYKDPGDGKQLYAAESGDLICVANFATATIDIGASSTANNGELNYAADPKKVPPLGTKVLLELVPGMPGK